MGWGERALEVYADFLSTYTADGHFRNISDGLLFFVFERPTYISLLAFWNVFFVSKTAQVGIPIKVNEIYENVFSSIAIYLRHYTDRIF